MTSLKKHRILIATDGSKSAQAALETAARFPWREGAQARVLIAHTAWLPVDSDWLTNSKEARTAFEKNFEWVASKARQALATRWSDPEVVFAEKMPATAILEEGVRFRATATVLGWRGHGTFRRLLAGSVSRSVAAHAPVPVLVVREAPKSVRRFVLAFDGSHNAASALDFLNSLDGRHHCDALPVNVVEHVDPSSSASSSASSACRTSGVRTRNPSSTWMAARSMRCSRASTEASASVGGTTCCSR